MTQGQVYSHWGKVDDEVHLDRSQIESMLANRTVFHTDMSTTAQQKREKTQNSTEVETKQDGTGVTCIGASGSTAAPVQPAEAAHAEQSKDVRAGREASADVGKSPEGRPRSNQGSGIELQAAGMSQQEKTAAAKEHNRRVLARAGLEALGRQESVDGDVAEGSGAQKRQKAGGTVKKLEKMMRKKFARS